MNKRTDKRTKVPCVLQHFVPFGAAAQKRYQMETCQVGHFCSFQFVEFLPFSVAISKRINVDRSGRRSFVEKTGISEFLQFTGCRDAHFILPPFLTKWNYNFLLGLD